MDFEQLAFIEKWRRRAARGIIVAVDGRRGDLLITLRVGELGERLDFRGRDATGAARKARLTVGDRATMAIEYAATDVQTGSGSGVTGDCVGPGAIIEGSVTSTGELVAVDVGGSEVLVRGDTIPAANVGDIVRFKIAEEGRAYLIPTR